MPGPRLVAGLKRGLAMACLLLSCACSQQDFDRNFQCHLLDEPRCARFREAFWNEGRKYASAASGSFVLAMQRVRNEAEAAGCDGRAAGNAAQAASPTRPSRPSRSSAAYRWKDSSGQWVLSDQPPPEGTPHEAIPLQRVR
jgi:hypothetical protein